MWTFRLKAGCRIGKGSAIINLQFVMRPRAAMSGPGNVSAGFTGEGISLVVQYYRKLFRLRRPNAKMRFVFADNFRPYRVTSLHSGVFSSDHCAMVVCDLASPVKLVRLK